MAFIACYIEAVCPDTRDNSALREYRLEKPGWMATIQDRPSSYVSYIVTEFTFAAVFQ